MNRQELFNLLDPVYPTYAIGEHKGECIESYIVLKFDGQLTSMNNSQCGWQFVHIFLYAPLGDITILDDMILEVKQALKNKLEDTGEITPEIIDSDKKAYMRRIKYRIPKEVV
ncbi:hypothetical protein [Clostridium ganghwense]|uniref:DUF3168 domain-containing protein n=1 Tax=Clostridium ganghwense TaxID=312089 RepID=A0ABT4CX52_9CLOT|nr:hypothetical protein [Clostridium ganghwense]MCY6372464.1 hypothetical protein [Clostridium ganghwense]